MKTSIALILGFGLVLSSFASPDKAAKQPPMLPYIYKTDPGLFVTQLKKLVPPREGESNQHLLLRAVKKQHIKLPKGSSLVLDEKEGSIRVMTTRAARAETDRFIQLVSEAK